MSKVTHSFVSVGQVIKCSLRRGKPLVKVRIPKMKLDTNLLMYFPAKKDLWCDDKEIGTGIGDIVVVTNYDGDIHGISHGIDSVLYKSGAVRDPVTGRLCRGTEFVDEEARESEKSKRIYEEVKITKKVEVS